MFETIKRFKKSFGFMGLMLAFISCDRADISPEVIGRALSNPVTILSFTVDNQNPTYGDMITFSWKIEDDENLVDAVEISPGVGVVSGLLGSYAINATETTTYELKVISTATNVTDVATVRVNVFTLQGDLIADVPDTEVSCDNDIDDDLNGLSDCFDEACFESPECAEDEVSCTVTAGFEPLNSEDGKIYIGETSVEVFWESDCDDVVISGLSGLDLKYPESGSLLPFTPQQSSTTVTIQGQILGALKDTQKVTIEAETRQTPKIPGYQARGTISVSPKEVLYGEAYTVSWTTSRADQIELCYDDFCDSEDLGDFLFVANATDSTSYTLRLTDARGRKGSHGPATVTVHRFSDTHEKTKLSELSSYEMAKGAKKGQFLFFDAAKIIKTNDFGQNFETINITKWDDTDAGKFKGEIKAVAMDSSETLYVSTTKGLFKIASGETDAVVIFPNFFEKTYNALYAASSSSIIIGNKDIVYHVYTSESDDDCKESGIIVPDSIRTNGYCYNYKAPFGPFGSVSAVIDRSVNLEKFLTLQKQSNVVIALLEGQNDSFLPYLSTDQGKTFESDAFLSGVKDGHNQYLWSDHQIWKMSFSGETELSVESLTMTGLADPKIQFVKKVGDHTFAATDAGTYYLKKDHSQWTKTDSTSAAKILMGGKTGSLESAEGDSETYFLNAIKANGTKSFLQWSYPLKFQKAVNVTPAIESAVDIRQVPVAGASQLFLKRGDL